MKLVLGKKCLNKVIFMEEDQTQAFFKGTYLASDCQTNEEEKSLTVKIGLGKRLGEVESELAIMESCATASRLMKEKNITEYSMDVSIFLKAGLENLYRVIEGTQLGVYHEKNFKEDNKTENDRTETRVHLLCGNLTAEETKKAETIVEEVSSLAKSVFFARDMVNLPGNRLRPVDFAQNIKNFAEACGVEVELFDTEKLREMGMAALLAVGDSSEFPPVMAVLRYHGDIGNDKVMGLIGKGVTCDTGGYCLKPADSMLGIKGDMAGGAAVVGAIAALAKNHVKANAVAVVPICENRISAGSLLPGDVIESYGKKTIEIANTDAEGRLILADAVSYAVKNEKVTNVLDIATLTGAVVGLLGFSIGGVICDNDAYYDEFFQASQRAKERYLRIPFYREHENMIESQVADIRNMGEKFCGTITAGLFIRAFAEKTPWLHLDIAGTAWVDTPVFAFQTKGATGAGVTTIYQLCKGADLS